MSFYANLKEIYNDTTQIVQEKDLSGKIRYLLKILSFVGVCLIFLLEECGLQALISFNIELKLPLLISDFLSEYILNIIVVYLVYFLILNTIIKFLILEIKTRTNKDFFPIWFTLQDIFRIVFYGIFLLKILQDMLLCIQGNDVIFGDNLFVYIYIVLNVMLRFVGKVYIQNENNWCYSTIKYTAFFDSDGKRIAEKDRVVYRNQIHELHRDKGTWMLVDDSGKSIVKLEDAVIDEDGKIRVLFWDMGKRKAEDEI